MTNTAASPTFYLMSMASLPVSTSPILNYLCNTLKTNGVALGYFINTTNTMILTSWNGTTRLPLISASNPKLGLSIANTIATLLTTPHPTDTTVPAIPVKLTHGFHPLGHPVGSATFANKFFAKRISIVNKCIISPNDSISDQQTKL
jgi:hypothetical protein